jgi:hypothetical protein
MRPVPGKDFEQASLVLVFLVAKLAPRKKARSTGIVNCYAFLVRIPKNPARAFHDQPASWLLAPGFGFLHTFLEFFDVVGRELRAIHLDRQLVELGGERERRLIVFVVHTGECVGADVEALVLSQNHGQSFLQVDLFFDLGGDLVGALGLHEFHNRASVRATAQTAFTIASCLVPTASKLFHALCRKRCSHAPVER